MLTVYSVLWGDKYAPDYVYRLRESVARNLRFAHRFVCVTDQDLHDIDTIAPPCDFPGWWQKIGLFRPGFADDLSIYFDLDVVIVDSLDGLVAKYALKPLSMSANFPQSGHGGWQSSVMFWNGVDNFERRRVWSEFNARCMRVHYGDQDYISEVAATGITTIESGRIVSYKYDCRDGAPASASVVLFHGKPDPHEVSDEWVIQNWRA